MRKIAGLALAAQISMASVVAGGLLSVGCTSDPSNPQTWIKKLDNPRDQKDAIRMLVKLKDKQAVAPLTALYKRSSDPELLRQIATFNDPSTVPLMVDSLDFTEDSYEAASVAATALGDLGDKAAVGPLIKTVLRPLPIKTRANVVKLEAMKSLAKLKDPRAVDALVKVLATPADEQDFFLNKVAAESLGEFADPKAVPALIRGLFMVGRGANIYQECRTALVRIGEPAVGPLIAAMQHKNPELEADAKRYEFVPGIVVQKLGFVLGDLRSTKAVPALLDELKKKDEGLAAGDAGVPAHQGTILALGLIGDKAVETPLIDVLKDAKRYPKERIAAAEALNALGDPAALPELLAVADTKVVNGTTVDPDAATVVAAAVAAYSRLAGPGVKYHFQKLPDDELFSDLHTQFQAAEDRIAVANECKSDVACYEKHLTDADSNKAEKAAFMLARSGQPGLEALCRHLNTQDAQARMAILFGVGHLGSKANASCVAALDKQIANDQGKPQPYRSLVQEMRVVRAQLSH